MDIKAYLKGRGIEFKVFAHSAVYTCEQARKDRVYCKIKGMHSKNLFLKERKGRRFYLVILPFDRKLDMDELGKMLGDKLKFANENDLVDMLGLAPGSVSPFGLINDKKHKVRVIIGRKVWDSDFVSFHPSVNTETLELSGKGFQKYIRSLPNKLKII